MLKEMEEIRYDSTYIYLYFILGNIPIFVWQHYFVSIYYSVVPDIMEKRLGMV